MKIEKKRYIVCRGFEKFDSPIYALDTSLKFEKFIFDYGRNTYLKFKYKREAQKVVGRLRRKNPDNNYFVDEIWI